MRTDLLSPRTCSTAPGRTLGGAVLAIAALFGVANGAAHAQAPQPVCPPQFSFNGNICERYLTRQPTCPGGWRYSRGRCERVNVGGGGGCRYRGSRGYDNPRGNTCKANYPISAWEDQNLEVFFRSDGRTWRWGETRYTVPSSWAKTEMRYSSSIHR